MTPDTVRPAPRGVRVLAVVTALTTVLLLGLGGLVTSFRVGMSDPVWPTEPWYLAANGHVWANEPQRGFLIEHTHRLAGFAVGGLATLLALAAWAYEPKRGLKVFGLAATLVLVAAYGAFHGAMMQSWKQEKALTSAAVNTGAATAAAAVALLAAATAAARGTARGKWVRVLASAGLVAVMVQGLLGGLRVFLNELVGTDLAAVHGVFGQLTFCVLVAVAVAAAPRRAGDSLPASARGPFLLLANWLVGLLVLQLVWAVMVRHHGTPLAQRLHMLTAFAVTMLVVWLAVLVLNSPVAKPRLGGSATHLVGILAVQLVLGVEAYTGKFTAAGPQATVPPMLRTPTQPQAITRTLHQLVGSGLLAAAVALAMRAGRQPVEAISDESADPIPAAARSPEPVGVP